MMRFIFLLFLCALPVFAQTEGTLLESLLAKVGREPVFLSDLQRFRELDEVLVCAGLRKREKALPKDTRELLDAYVDEELMFLEAKARKASTAGIIPESVKKIHSSAECKEAWQN